MLKISSRARLRFFPHHLCCRAVTHLAVVVAALLTLAPALPAFPPNPHYTIYGVVRDQVGATLAVEGATIILLRDGKEIGRAPISATLQSDGNYELTMSIDQNRPSSRLYANNALPSQGVFSLVVEMNGSKFFPIEVAGTLRAGNGGERVRLDLNLGVDNNHDGLPDAWQEWQLYQAGYRPGTNGWDLSLVPPSGDLDGDGISNYDEYIAGTFAGDATERFELKITGKTSTSVVFEFFAITGKQYSIEESADLHTWTPVAFAVTPGGTPAKFFNAPQVDIRPAYVALPSGASRFYRLSVQ